MPKTYAIKWQEPDGRTCVGRLELRAGGLRLEGLAPDWRFVRREVGYEAMRTPHLSDRRLDGRPTLVLELAEGALLVTSAGAGAGIVHELVERLAQLRLAPS